MKGPGTYRTYMLAAIVTLMGACRDSCELFRSYESRDYVEYVDRRKFLLDKHYVDMGKDGKLDIVQHVEMGPDGRFNVYLPPVIIDDDGKADQRTLDFLGQSHPSYPSSRGTVVIGGSADADSLQAAFEEVKDAQRNCYWHFAPSEDTLKTPHNKRAH